MTTVKAFKYLACINTGDVAHVYESFISEVFIPEDPTVGRDCGMCFNVMSGCFQNVFECPMPRNYTSSSLEFKRVKKEDGTFEYQEVNKDRTELLEIELPLEFVNSAYENIKMQRALKLATNDFAKTVTSMTDLKLDDLIVNYKIQEIRSGKSRGGTGYCIENSNISVMQHSLGDGKRSLVVYPDGTDIVVYSHEEYVRKYEEFKKYYYENKKTLDPIYNQYFIRKIHSGQVYSYNNYGKKGDIKGYHLPDGINIFLILPDKTQVIGPKNQIENAVHQYEQLKIKQLQIKG